MMNNNEHYYRIVRSDELYHYGKKGMRWGVIREKIRSGVRKIGEVSSSISSKAGNAMSKLRKKRVEEKLQSANSVNKPKNVEEMSTEDIKKATARLKAISEYNAEAEKFAPKKKENAIKSAIKDFMKDQGKVLVKNLGDSAISKFGATDIGRALGFGEKAASNAIASFKDVPISQLSDRDRSQYAAQIKNANAIEAYRNSHGG